LCAVAEKEYATPFVRPVTVIGDWTRVAVAPPGDAVTVYRTMDAPPASSGAEKLTTAVPSEAARPVIRGASGTFPGVVGADAVEVKRAEE
jgi:hypothetical protein